ncbi:MAG: hypothetical protein ACMUHX_10960 [bacterium]
MYICNYRIFDWYKKEAVSLAIVTDASAGFRPHCYETGRDGDSDTALSFPWQSSLITGINGKSLREATIRLPQWSWLISRK